MRSCLSFQLNCGILFFFPNLSRIPIYLDIALSVSYSELPCVFVFFLRILFGTSSFPEITDFESASGGFKLNIKMEPLRNNFLKDFINLRVFLNARF